MYTNLSRQASASIALLKTSYQSATTSWLGIMSDFLMVPVINYLFKVVLMLALQLKHTEVIDDYPIQSFVFFEEVEFMPLRCVPV